MGTKNLGSNAGAEHTSYNGEDGCRGPGWVSELKVAHCPSITSDGKTAGHTLLEGLGF